MADSGYINSDFTQMGNICVLASYATVIEYFSDKDIKIRDFLGVYAKHKNIKSHLLTKKAKNKRQDNISKAFHDYCHFHGIRGFDYVKKIHEEDTLNTEEFCTVEMFKVQLESVDGTELLGVKTILEDKDALAMICYKVSEKLFHTVVVGYDKDEASWFYKDPEKSQVQFGNIWEQVDVWEYIVFS